MVADLSYPTAVLGGALSFLSPCVLPLVPPYLWYMAGVSADDLKSGPAVATTGYARLIGSSVIFVLGFSTVFVALGAGASSIGLFLRQNLDWLGMVAGIAIIVMGLNFLGVFKLSFLSREARMQAPDRPRSLLGAYLMGLAFAFGWTPCIGPILATILTLAASQESLGYGVALLTTYSLGLGIPFIAAALGVRAFLAFSSSFRKHLHKVEIAAGVLLVGTGVLMVLGSFELIATYLINTFPALGKLG